MRMRLFHASYWLARALTALACVALLLAGCGSTSARQAHTHATPTKTTGPTPTPTTGLWGTLPKPTPSLCTPGSNLTPLPSTLSTLYATTDPGPASTGDLLALNAADGSQRWSYSFGGHASRVLLDGASVYIYFERYFSVPGGMVSSAHLVALGAADGALHWQADLAGHPETMLAAGGVLYLTTTDGSASALDGATGTVIWTTPLAAKDYVLSATLVDRTLYVVGHISSTQGSFVAAVSASDGTVLWRVMSSAIAYVPPVVANGLVYAALTDTTLAAFDAETGTVRWQVDLGGVPYTYSFHSLVASGTGLYVSTGAAQPTATPHARYAFNARTGALCWASLVEGWYAYDAAMLDGRLMYYTAFCGDPNPPNTYSTGCVYAVDAHIGTPRWRFQLTGGPNGRVTPASLVNSVMYLNTVPALALRVDSGATIWSDSAPPNVDVRYHPVAGLQVTGTTVYVGYHDGTVRALDAATGAVRWSVTLSSPITTVMAGA